MDKKYLRRAVKKVGGQYAMAKALGISQPRVWNWIYRDVKAPSAEYVIPIEKLTGISRHDLRPDIYPSNEK